MTFQFHSTILNTFLTFRSPGYFCLNDKYIWTFLLRLQSNKTLVYLFHLCYQYVLLELICHLNEFFNNPNIYITTHLQSPKFKKKRTERKHLASVEREKNKYKKNACILIEWNMLAHKYCILISKSVILLKLLVFLGCDVEWQKKVARY